MYGAGSGIFLKNEGKFYLLTAHHVIDNATSYRFNNESPFWITSKSKYGVKTLYDFLMPAQIFHIGELIVDKGVSIDSSDLVLIELFYPPPMHMPDNYIDLDSRPRRTLRKDEYFEGQLLLASGFPFEKNYFEFHDEVKEHFTHSTPVQRHICEGVCKSDGGEPYMTIDGISDGSYMRLSGASGGIVTNITPKSNQVRMAGMLLSAGSNIIRFIPAYLIEYAIQNKASARRTLVDPAMLRAFSLEEHMAMASQYAATVRNEAKPSRI